ncbi:hypothetical protein C8J57DRAFT_1518224 [Mycena rebaudengoi]|nr:hypothetical protein C8J57DRAFT_1518224 [Mycena rebaudengoi]
MAFSDDDKRIFCNGDTQFTFDAQSGEILTEYPTPVEEQHITIPHSTDRAKLASISVTTTITVIDTTTGLIIRPLFTCQNADIRPSALEYSPDGTLVACVTRDAFAFPSDSKSLTVLFANSAIALYDLAHLESDALVVLYTFPPANPFHVQRPSMRGTDAGPIDASGWLYGYTGKRILWLPPMKRKIWAATGRQLILEDTHGQLVIIDLADYLKSHPQVNRAWRPGGFRVESDSSTSDELAMAVHRVNIADASKGKNINPSG